MNDLLYPSFAYEKKGDGAVILRCFSRDGTVKIPEHIGGLPVRELGAYAFSAHMDPDALDGALVAGADYAGRNYSSENYASKDYSSENYAGGISEKCTEPSGADALSGDRLEEIILPRTISRVGRYCFYNCGHLRRLEFSGSLEDWGSGAFTGCHRVQELCVHADPEEETGLKQVLDELPEKLHVEFCHDKRVLLAFPEFYEEGVENTPARILETHVHGTGIRYRNCFQGKRLDFSLYDSLFLYAQAQENELLLTELVLGRLRFPYRLGQQEKTCYEAYVRGNLKIFGTYFLDQRDLGGLQWFLECFAVGNETLQDFLSEYALRRGDAAAQSRLMEFRRQNGAGHTGRKKLEL